MTGKLRGMRVLITGIAGFAGSHLAEFILKLGHEVHGIFLVDKPISNLDSIKDQIHLYPCDIASFSEIKGVIAEINPDRIFHLAGLSKVGISWVNREATLRTNFFGTFNLFEAIREMESHPRILSISSAQIYGRVEESLQPIKETQPLNPLSPYALSKASQELLSSYFVNSENMDIVTVRPFPHIGPRQEQGFVCSDFASQIAEIERGACPPEIVVGNLEARRDFTDVRDMVRAYWLTLEKGVKGEVYNISSGRVYSIKELLFILLEMSKVKIEIIQDNEHFRPLDIPLLGGDSDKFIKCTKWEPEISFHETLSDILDYWRNSVNTQ